MKKAHLGGALVAIALFVWVLTHVGISSLVEQLKAMRIALPIVLALSMLRLFLQSITWSVSLNGGGVSVSIPRLAGTRLAGQSMGYLTVLGPVISEPLKIELLGTSTDATVAATFLDNGVYWFTSALLAIVGIASLPFVAAHGAIYHSIPAVFVLALMVLVITRRNPILSGLVRVLGKKAPSWLKRAEQFESSIRKYRLNQPALVRRIFWIDVACQALIVSEVVVVLWALHLSIHFFTILVIEGVTRGLKMLSGWIPARLGSDEGGAISAFALIGFSPMLGLALALTRRARDLLWAFTGIVLLAWSSRGQKLSQDTDRPIPTLLAGEEI
jgi:lysylphosphatidylglycerol synthase-like protein